MANMSGISKWSIDKLTEIHVLKQELGTLKSLHRLQLDKLSVSVRLFIHQQELGYRAMAIIRKDCWQSLVNVATGDADDYDNEVYEGVMKIYARWVGR